MKFFTCWRSNMCFPADSEERKRKTERKSARHEWEKNVSIKRHFRKCSIILLPLLLLLSVACAREKERKKNVLFSLYYMLDPANLLLLVEYIYRFTHTFKAAMHTYIGRMERCTACGSFVVGSFSFLFQRVLEVFSNGYLTIWIIENFNSD